MNKGQGVVYINYVDDKISSGMNGHAVNIFFDVYDFVKAYPVVKKFEEQ
nr:MAG TPA: hypothetical protein [Caudoviricetes sp.]